MRKAKPTCNICGDPLKKWVVIYGSKFEATHHVHCDTCQKPLTVCDVCFDSQDDCNACHERREKEQWCPMCDAPTVNMTPAERALHGHHCKVGRP